MPCIVTWFKDTGSVLFWDQWNREHLDPLVDQWNSHRNESERLNNRKAYLSMFRAYINYSIIRNLEFFLIRKDYQFNNDYEYDKHGMTLDMVFELEFKEVYESVYYCMENVLCGVSFKTPIESRYVNEIYDVWKLK